MGLFSRFFKKNDTDTEATEAAEVPAEDSTDSTESAEVPAEDSADAAEDSADSPDSADSAVEPPEDENAKEAPRDRAENGPWDESEDSAEANRLDLGSLRIPVLDGMQVQLEAEEQSGTIKAVTLVHNGGGLQVQAFAAPKTEGLWRDVRTQISANITASGGSAKELYTPLGYELSATVPVALPDDKVAARPVRFMGVDGPRWFLRGVLSDEAIRDEDVRDALVEVFRTIVVVRGEAPMPPRELLPLTPPNMSSASDADDTKRTDDDINPFERGPEIAEVR